MLVLFIMLWTTGCIGVSLPAPTPTATPNPAADPAANSTAPDEPQQMMTATISTDEQGASILTHVDETLTERGEPLRHDYVELEDETGRLWQGESLTYDAERLHILQPVQSGGASVLQAVADVDVALRPVVLQASIFNSSDAPPPNVTVDFVRAEQSSDGTWRFDVTLSHPDTGWEDYADGWHVEAADGAILGTRILLHPHVNEQPFTRSLSGVEIGDGVSEVFIRSHDSISGYSVDPLRVPINEAGSGERYEVVR